MCAISISKSVAPESKRAVIWYLEDNIIAGKMTCFILGTLECKHGENTAPMYLRMGSGAEALLYLFERYLELEENKNEENAAELKIIDQEFEDLFFIILDNTLQKNIDSSGKALDPALPLGASSVTGLTLAAFFRGAVLNSQQMQEFKEYGFNNLLVDAMQKIVRVKGIDKKIIIINSDHKEKYAASEASLEEKLLSSLILIPKPLKGELLLNELKKTGSPSYTLSRGTRKTNLLLLPSITPIRHKIMVSPTQSLGRAAINTLFTGPSTTTPSVEVPASPGVKRKRSSSP